MSATKRPPLNSLSSRFAKKEPSASAAPAASVAPAPAGDVPVEALAPGSAKKDERVQILVRIDPATRKRLKMIAVEQDVTIQDLCEEAIRDIVKRNAR